jgi:uncharacterized protein
MLRAMFCRYALRTTDLAAARKFYAEAIGLALPDGVAEGSVLEAWPLHERARALGAPAHWLGQLAVSDVEAMLARLVALGGESLGPIVRARDGATLATLRDPFGAVIAVRAAAQPTGDSPIAWHQLHTQDLDGAWALYHALFGWVHMQTLEVPDPVGGYRLFAWNQTGARVGGMGNTARRPGVHAHWLFCLPVVDIQAAVVRVRALGGTATAPLPLVDGMLLSGCEDPQGAAFGLAQRAGAMPGA